MVLEGDATIKERLEMMKKQRESVKEQMAKLQQTLDTLDYKVWYYSTAEKAGTTAVPRNMPEEQVPENLRAARRRLKIIHAKKKAETHLRFCFLCLCSIFRYFKMQRFAESFKEPF